MLLLLLLLQLLLLQLLLLQLLLRDPEANGGKGRTCGGSSTKVGRSG